MAGTTTRPGRQPIARSAQDRRALAAMTAAHGVMAASIAGPVAGGMLADRFGRVRTLIVTYLAAAAALAGFGFARRNLGLLAVVGVLVGLLAYAESPLLQAVFSDSAGDGAVRAAFGALFAISYGVGSLWTAVIGWVISAAGFPAAFAVAAAIIAAAARDGGCAPGSRAGAAPGSASEGDALPA